MGPHSSFKSEPAFKAVKQIDQERELIGLLETGLVAVMIPNSLQSWTS